MIKSVTSATVFNDAVGLRLSITYSEIDENTGTIITDNNRTDRIIAKDADKKKCNDVLSIAQSFVNQS